MFELTIVSKASGDVTTLLYDFKHIQVGTGIFCFFNELLCLVVRDIRSTGVVNDCYCSKLFVEASKLSPSLDNKEWMHAAIS